MRIGLDARALIFTRAGIASYLYNIVTSIAEMSNDELFLFSSSPDPSHLSKRFKNISEVTVRFPHINVHFERFWQEQLLPRAVRRGKIDIFHGPRFFVPERLSCPSVVTVHDLAFKRYPSFVTKSAYANFDGMVRRSVVAAEKIIVPSPATRSDLMELYGVHEGKIEVVCEGADEAYRPITDEAVTERVLAKYGIKGKYILFAGTVEPRKNISGLLETYSMIESRRDHILVIAGAFGWLYKEILQKMKDLRLGERVVWTGYVPSEDLACLYSACEIFAFPSFYEGFGLPVLEAMQCGAAVITSNTSAMKDLFSDAALMIDPGDPRMIANAIDRVLADEALRGQLRSKALSKAKEFSWRAAAGRTLEIYRGVRANYAE